MEEEDHSDPGGENHCQADRIENPGMCYMSMFSFCLNFVQCEFGCLHRVAGPNEEGHMLVRWDTLVSGISFSCTFECADLETVLNLLVVVPVSPSDVCYLVLLQEGPEYLRVADSI